MFSQSRNGSKKRNYFQRICLSGSLQWPFCAGFSRRSFVCCPVTFLRFLSFLTWLSSKKHFLEEVKRVCSKTNEHIIVSYSRPALEQTGVGHFSPVGGYHPGRNMVLILDVARFKGVFSLAKFVSTIISNFAIVSLLLGAIGYAV